METISQSIEKIRNADLPPEVQATCQELLETSQELITAMPATSRWRIRRLVEHLASEVADPSTPIHTWEMALDLVILEGEKAGAEGKLAVGCASRLRSILGDWMGVYGPVSLEILSMETAWAITLLSDTLREPQSLMVAPNVYSLAQAHFNEHAWFRGIFAGKAPVGFMMIVDDDQTPEYFLWRFMIGHPYQGRGYGRDAIELLVEYVRSRPSARELGVSCGEGPGSPEGFYRKLGFVPTGEKLEDEIVLIRVL